MLSLFPHFALSEYQSLFMINAIIMWFVKLIKDLWDNTFIFLRGGASKLWVQQHIRELSVSVEEIISAPLAVFSLGTLLIETHVCLNQTVQSCSSLCRWQNRPFLESSQIVTQTKSFWAWALAWACLALSPSVWKTAAAAFNSNEERCLKISCSKSRFSAL